MTKKIILETIVGSTVHGTNVSDGLEDLDLMAVVIEDLNTHCGFSTKDVWTERSKPEGVRSEAGDTDWVGYGLKKFLLLALSGNPSVLIPFFAPAEFTRIMTPEGLQLRALISSILSKNIYMPFQGYMRQQHERLLGLRGQRNVTRPELVDAYGYDTKYAGHIIRLGFQGEELLLTGQLTLPMKEEQRELCIKVRMGKFTLPEVSTLIIDAEKKLDAAFLASTLPDKPNRDKVEQWMLETYINAWSRNKIAEWVLGTSL